jgi:hypothetical protein
LTNQASFPLARFKFWVELEEMNDNITNQQIANCTGALANEFNLADIEKIERILKSHFNSVAQTNEQKHDADEYFKQQFEQSK